MGLNHPRDLTAWRAEHERRHRIRRIVSQVRHRASASPTAADWILTRGSQAPRALLVLDSLSPTSVASVLRPAAHLAAPDVAILAPAQVTHLLPVGDWESSTVDVSALTGELESVKVVLAAADYLPVGAAAYDWATERGVPFLIVQHGLLTPFAAPLPPDAHLLAWNQADADFWTSGRTDVQATVVGSQLLHEVATGPRATPASDAIPIYLGQLHGAELPRAAFARSAYRFCRETGATYRPHPSEKDKVSRLIHAAWERRGIVIDRSTTPLAHLDRPVVSAFSTGVLEAAARGLPAWVDFIDPPTWLTDFWDRYAMARWGAPPTPAPTTDGNEPAAAIAQLLQSAW